MPKRNLTSAKKGAPAKAIDAPAPSTTPPQKRTRVVEVEIDPDYVAGRRRPSDDEVVARQDQAYRLRLLGKTPEEIGVIMGLAPRTVRDSIQKARARQVEELKRLEGKAGVVRQFAVLNYVLEESLDAWDRSKRTRKTKVAGVETKDVSLGSGNKALPGTETKKKSSQKEEEEIGDPGYLDRAMKASKEIRDLLGLDPPEVKRLLIADDPVTKDLTNEDLLSLPTEELLRRYRAAAGIGSELG